MTTRAFTPDSIITQTGCAATTAQLSSQDTNWESTTSLTSAPTLQVGFLGPDGTLNAGANLQTITVQSRKKSSTATGSPTYTIGIYEVGGSVALATSSAISVTSTTGQVNTFTFNSNLLAGKACEVRLTGTVGGTSTNRNTPEWGYIGWTADFTPTAIPSSAFALVNNANTSVTHIGSGIHEITKNGGVNSTWDADAVSSTGTASDFIIRIKPAALVNVMFGVSASPTTSSNDASIQRCVQLHSSGNIGIYESGTQYVSIPTAGYNYTASDYLFLRRSGSTITLLKGSTTSIGSATLIHTFSNLSGTLFFDSSFFTNGEIVQVYMSWPAITATAAPSLGSFTSSSIAVVITPKITAVASPKPNSFTATSTITARIKGTVSSQLSSITSSSTVKSRTKASVSSVLDSFTSGAATKAKIHGAEASILNSFSGTATVQVRIQAQASSTLDAFTSSAQASVRIQGQAVFTLSSFTATSVVATRIKAQAVPQINAFTALGAGTVSSNLPRSANVNKSLNPFSANGAIKVKIKTATQSTFAELTASSTVKAILPEPHVFGQRWRNHPWFSDPREPYEF